MNKTITYNLNEASLRAVFEQYEIGFDESHWAETEKSLESVGFQPKDVLTAKARKLVFFCCLVVVGGSLAAFINFNTHRESTGNLAASAITEQITGIKIESEVGLMNLQRKATVLTATAVTADSVKPEPAQLAINENVAAAEKKIETTVVTPVPTPEVEKTAEVKTEPKKKKRRNRRANSQESDVPAPVTHSHADDDVIIGD